MRASIRKIFVIAMIIVIAIFQNIAYSGDWSCASVKYYYDVNKNNKYDSQDIDITQNVTQLIRDGKQYLPLHTIIKVDTNSYCRRWLYLHWCSNTAHWTNYVNGIDRLTVYKGGDVVPKIVDKLYYETTLDNSLNLQKLYDLYAQNTYTDLSFENQYNGQYNIWDYASPKLLVAIPSMIETKDFEYVIMKENLQNIISYINENTQLYCSISYPTTAYAKITCGEYVPQYEYLTQYDNETNTTQTYEILVGQKYVSETYYLNFEMLFLYLNEKNLANLKTIETVEFEVIGDQEPVKIAENVEEFVITKPGKYSFSHTPQRIKTCHVDPHGVNVCL